MMKTILIVDDDIEVRNMMRFVLRNNGYSTIESEDGLSAFTIALEKNPDLIISDILMHNMNGFMLYEMLNGNPKTEKIPVILMTGAAQNVGAWKTHDNVGYFEKPINTKELLIAVQHRL